MKVHVLGSSGTFPDAGRPASGYLVTHEGTNVCLDLGPGTYARLVETIDVVDLAAVVISHRHPDHCTDLLALFHRLAYGPPIGHTVRLLAPSSVVDTLDGLAGSDGLSAGFDVAVVENESRVEIGEMRLTFVAMDHSVPCLGTRIDTTHRSFGYTADTGPAGDWPAVFRDVDVLLAEASQQGPPGSHSYTQHLTATDAGRIAREIGARRLVLTHIPPYLDVEVSVQEAESVFDRPVPAAQPGMTIEV